MTNLYDSINPANFDKIVNDQSVKLFTITNKQQSKLLLTNFGAKIVALLVKDKYDQHKDVVLGHDSIDDYLQSQEPYFGAVCGRYANRIAKGQFTLEGNTYQLNINNPPNTLHGGTNGFHNVVWNGAVVDQQSVVFDYFSLDKEEGFPGNLHAAVTYRLTDNNEVVIDYVATTNKVTVVNLTNHSYFNLSGAGDNSILDHQLSIRATHYLPTDDTAIPLGDPQPVEHTPFDFTTTHTVGERIDTDCTQLNLAKGYDHSFVLDPDPNTKVTGLYTDVARCHSPQTGITMYTSTTEPAIQLYTGNWMTGKVIGKQGLAYPHRSALCLETQHFPDSPNHPHYPTTTLLPDKVFSSKTVYRFTVE